MRVIIAGSRSITSLAAVGRAIEASGYTITEVVGGEAPGVDRVGRQWAKMNGVLFTPMPADHTKWPLAGKLRNESMAVYADALIAVWDGRSPGTLDMFERMHSKKKPYYVHLHRS